MKKKLDPAKLPIYEVDISFDMDLGMDLISVVDRPAIMIKGMLFNEDSELEYSKYNFEIVEEGDEQIIVGPALIPDIDIFRDDEKYGPHFIRFTKDTIKLLVERFNSKGDNRRINVDHSNRIVNAFILEDWLIEDSLYDKSRMYGFKLPVGTYMLKVKIQDKDFWLNEVKEKGKFGFSIEGFLGQKLVKLEKEQFIVKPSAGESENEFISRCIEFEVNSGMEQEQAIAVCYNIWENKSDFNIDDLSLEDLLELFNLK